VVLVEHLGEQTLVYARTPASDDLVTVRVNGIGRAKKGETVQLAAPHGSFYLFSEGGNAFTRLAPETAE
jgi:hypothetical protein